MPLWELFVELVRATLFAVAPFVGDSLGGAIVMLSVVVRLALLPLTLRAARRLRAESATLKQLAAEMKVLGARHATDPETYRRELERVHERLGYRPAPLSRNLVGTLVQLPFFAALYAAIARGLGAGVRFLWIGSLARPDLVLVALILALGLASQIVSSGGIGTDVSRGTLVLWTLASVVITGALFSRLAAGLGLYWAASSAVVLLQMLILRREEGRAA